MSPNQYDFYDAGDFDEIDDDMLTGPTSDNKPAPDDATCMCDGFGYLLTERGAKVICPQCHGAGDQTDDDPQCDCGVYRSEHALCGCPEGFQSKGSWAVERDFIRDLDDDAYDAIYGP